MAMNNFETALKFFEDGKLNQAENIFNDLKQKDKNNAEIYYYLGEIAFRKDQYEKAETLFEKAISLNDQEAKYYEMLGETLGIKAQQAGMVKGALLLRKVKNTFEKALQLNPNSLIAREGLFMIYLFSPPVSGGDAKKAHQFLEEIKKLNSSHGYLAQAMIHIKENNLEEADKAFEQAVKNNGTDREVLMRSARFFLRRKNFNKVIEIADRYIQHFPNDPRGYQLKGEAFFKNNQTEDALNSFNLAIEKDEAFLNAYFHRAQVFLAKNDLQKAREDVHTILQHPNAPKELKNQAKKLM